MEECEQSEKSLRDLIEIICFTENLSTKIHGVLNEAEIYRIVNEEFKKSKRFNSSILLLTDNGSKLRLVESTLPHGKLKMGEKLARVQMKEYEIDLNESITYSKVIREEKTIQVKVTDIINELFPGSLASKLSNILGYEKKLAILTPLTRHGEIMGVFATSSTALVEQFIPSVKNLAQHISAAMELADEHARRTVSEEALRANEGRYRSLIDDVLDSSKVGLFILDSDFKVVWMNYAMGLYFGLQKEEVIGKDKKQLICERIKDIFEDPDNFAQRVIATYENNTYIENFECHVLPGDVQQERWLEHWSQPIRSGIYAGGRIEHYYDITERKRAEEELGDREETMRALLNASLETAALMDVRGNIIALNETAAKRLGKSPSELVGTCVFDQFPPDVAEYRKNQVNEVIRSGKPVRFEDERTGRWFDHCIYPIFDAQRKVVRLAIFNRDITRHKRAEEILTRSEKKYRDLIEAIDEVCYIVQDCKIIFVNKAFLRLFGFTYEKIIKQDFTIFVAPESLAAVTKYYRLKLEEKLISDEFEFNGIHKNGHRIILEARINRMEFEGKPAIVSILRNITERKNLEKQMLQQEKLAAIGRVTAGVAHEINNPLDVLLSKIESIQIQGINSNEISEHLNDMKNQILRISRITQALLSHSKDIILDFVPLDINSVLESVLFMFRFRESEKSVLIETNFSKKLPNIMGDSFELEKVVTNILHNAIYAMPKKGKITITSKMVDKDFIQVEFSDSGVGITEENLEKIFEPFFTTKESSEGTGLGLFLCNKIIKSHNGSIEVKSRVGKGTTIIITLPSAKIFRSEIKELT